MYHEGHEGINSFRFIGHEFLVMSSLATGVAYFDLEFLGTPHVIATAVIQGPAGVALIDLGPSTSLAGLVVGLQAGGWPGGGGTHDALTDTRHAAPGPLGGRR